jgi:hypothetical protein
MENQFVANGEQRWLNGQGASREGLARAKRAREWAQSGFLRRIRLRWLIWCESHDPKQTGRRPSPGTLW